MAKNTTLRNKPANNRVMATATHQTVTHYEGAIPHPEILRGFELQVPGSAARLIKLAEDESAHRRKLELMTIDANISAQQQQLDLGSQQTKSVFIDFQINNFDLNGYHPFKGCYPYGLQTSCNGNLISERL
jgi:uncharacterized membrane protein